MYPHAIHVQRCRLQLHIRMWCLSCEYVGKPHYIVLYLYCTDCFFTNGIFVHPPYNTNHHRLAVTGSHDYATKKMSVCRRTLKQSGWTNTMERTDDESLCERNRSILWLFTRKQMFIRLRYYSSVEVRVEFSLESPHRYFGVVIRYCYLLSTHELMVSTHGLFNIREFELNWILMF